MPNEGHRKIAFAFNRLHGQKRKMKQRKSGSVPKNLIWAMDLTGKTDANGKQHPVLGIIEHQSRACLTLSAVADKSTMTSLRIPFNLFETYQKPKCIRTDNEMVFTSFKFRFGLWLLRIKHQRTGVACPWMNGRIERLHGTLKEKLNQWEIDSQITLNHSLQLFQFWYNHIRPHQHLEGLTPA